MNTAILADRYIIRGPIILGFLPIAIIDKIFESAVKTYYHIFCSLLSICPSADQPIRTIFNYHCTVSIDEMFHFADWICERDHTIVEHRTDKNLAALLLLKIVVQIKHVQGVPKKWCIAISLPPGQYMST